MKKYTIYCTPEQTKKALTLGAPIEYANHFNACLPHKMIDFVGESGKMECAEFVIPTAEEMIGWLEEQGIHIEPEYDLTHKYYDFCILDENKPIDEDRTMFNVEFGLPSYKTRKEATLSAIDTALECLINKTMEE